MKGLSQTQSPIFMLLCVLCIQRQSFLTFILDLCQHVSEISAKASKTLGFLHQNRPFAHQETKEVAYKMLVRTKLEYAAAVWNPYIITECGQL